jgi:hypothetical protein
MPTWWGNVGHRYEDIGKRVSSVRHTWEQMGWVLGKTIDSEHEFDKPTIQTYRSKYSSDFI